MGPEGVSIIVINYNRRELLRACWESIFAQETGGVACEYLLVDNGSTDGSVDDVAREFPQVRIVRSAKNSFGHAFNQGLAASTGDFVLFVNNDVRCASGWFLPLYETLRADRRLAGVQSTVLFDDGRINSLGGEDLGDFYFRDRGFGASRDQEQTLRAEPFFLSGASVLYRRSLLREHGGADEDFIFYAEDVDLGIRLRGAGYGLAVEPRSIVHHRYCATLGSEVNRYFNGRNRYGLIAKHSPERFPDSFTTCRLRESGDLSGFYAGVTFGWYKLHRHHPGLLTDAFRDRVRRALTPLVGERAVNTLFARMEVAFGQRPLRVGIFDHALHLIGGGQRLNAEFARALEDTYAVDLIGTREVTAAQIRERYGIELTRARCVTIPVSPGFLAGAELFDPNLIAPPRQNDFEAVSVASAPYDIFINGSMIPHVAPRSPVSVFFCHFPDSDRQGYFFVPDYDLRIANSAYTAEHMARQWGLSADLIIYPPVRAGSQAVPKEDIILSVARFEPGGTKRQKEMIAAFSRLCGESKDVGASWQLYLVGGSARTVYGGEASANTYLAEVMHAREHSPYRDRIHIIVNASDTQVRGLMARARIFWHLCGMGAHQAKDVEHFGMASVEAMASGCVPVMFDGGGQREVLSADEPEGYFVRTPEELCSVTDRLIHDPGRIEQLRMRARTRAGSFSTDLFVQRVRALIGAISAAYTRVCHDTLEGEWAELKMAEHGYAAIFGQFACAGIPVRDPRLCGLGELIRAGFLHPAGRKTDEQERLSDMSDEALCAMAAYQVGVAEQRSDAFLLALRETPSALARAIKRLIHVPLRFYTFRQRAFNLSVSSAVRALAAVCTRLVNGEKRILPRLQDLERLRDDHSERLASMEKRIDDLLRTVQGLTDEQRLLLRMQQLRSVDALEAPVAGIALERGEGPIDEEAAYYMFELSFRGSEEEIRDRQRRYPPLFAQSPGPVLDIGCGRGELLELFRDAGIAAAGVDNNRYMVERCRQKGLNVVRQDAVAYLSSCAGGSWGGIVSCQVVEHLSPDLLMRLIYLAYEKLLPGGKLVIETLDPRDIVTAANEFYRDLSHRTHVHPETLAFLVKSAGFTRCVIEELPPAGDRALVRLNDESDKGRTIQENFDRLSTALFRGREYVLIGER